MDFKHEQTIEDIRRLLADLAEPWGDPLSFSGFGTLFQNNISRFADIFEAIEAVDLALINWASSVDPKVVLHILAEIITNPPDAAFHNNLISRRKDQWDGAIGKMISAVQTSHPDIVDKLINLEQMTAVRPYLD